jgi:hypothetical protein
MVKLEIYIPTDSRFAQPVTEKEFLLSEDRQRYVWQGRALTIDEFNAVADDVLRKKRYYKRPTVRVFEVEDEVEKPTPKNATTKPKPKKTQALPKEEEELEL